MSQKAAAASSTNRTKKQRQISDAKKVLAQTRSDEKSGATVEELNRKLGHTILDSFEAGHKQALDRYEQNSQAFRLETILT